MTPALGTDAAFDEGITAGAARALRARKARDAAMILPIAGVICLMPPVATIFAVDGRIAGVPVVLAYVSAVWLALIGFAVLLAPRLSPRGEAPRDHRRPAATDG